MQVVATFWPYLLTAVQLTLAAAMSVHVVLHKRDVRAAIGWIGLAWLVPFGGSLLYLLFGINRIRRRASGMRGRRAEGGVSAARAATQIICRSITLAGRTHLCAIGELMDHVTGLPLTAGNRIEALSSGRDAYRSMLQAIEAAHSSIALATYIFDNDPAGRVFVRALQRAAARGVQVRVLVDSVGARYAHPSIATLFTDGAVDFAEFLPTRFPFALSYANLRNHRKIMVVDATTGFVGGMNIRAGYLRTRWQLAITDIHFRLTGPVIRHLMDTFAEDWFFTTGHRADRTASTGERDSGEAPGEVFARGIAAGPDEALGRIRWAMLGALAVAQDRVRIVTPYFLPDPTMMTALMLAAMRSVRVDIILPARGNLRLVQWASRAKLTPLLARGVRIWLTPPPFDHGKLMTVDGAWALIGSANCDPRSLRLNFEFNVECYSASLAADLDRRIDARLAQATPYRLDDDQGRSLPTRLRDGAAWLLSPYL